MLLPILCRLALQEFPAKVPCLQGRINFDHNKKKLDILMVPTDGGDTLMNTESLSGGEKSFSTVAFLMALWSNMELPFYSLDEYDVFMVRCYQNMLF